MRALASTGLAQHLDWQLPRPAKADFVLGEQHRKRTFRNDHRAPFGGGEPNAHANAVALVLANAVVPVRAQKAGAFREVALPIRQVITSLRNTYDRVFHGAFAGTSNSATARADDCI